VYMRTTRQLIVHYPALAGLYCPYCLESRVRNDFGRIRRMAKLHFHVFKSV
jgi:hypothetical protein